jgi:probable rRNA maturation factor
MIPAHRLSLAVQYACTANGLPARPRLRRWVAAALERDAVVTLRFVDAREGRALNRAYRGKDYATNVLTFVYESGKAVAGDIVLCVPVLRREARAQEKTLLAHCAHLTVHGLLHLQGYDHERSAEARRMEAREAALLARLRFAHPYR